MEKVRVIRFRGFRFGGLFRIRDQLVPFFVQQRQNTGFQFVRGRVGKRRDEDLPHGDALQDQTQDEMRDRVGLAGPRARLDQISAMVDRIVGKVHAFPPFPPVKTTAPKNASARDSTSFPDGISPPKNAPNRSASPLEFMLPSQADSASLMFFVWKNL